MPNTKVRTEPIPKHRILRDVYRHYLEYRDIVTNPTGQAENGRTSNSATCEHGIIEHGYWIERDGVRVREMVTLSFWDLHYGLRELSARKREAIFWNVILDKKQKDVAEIMGITTVSVGQYVEQGMLLLAKRYFAEAEE